MAFSNAFHFLFFFLLFKHDIRTEGMRGLILFKPPPPRIIPITLANSARGANARKDKSLHGRLWKFECFSRKILVFFFLLLSFELIYILQVQLDVSSYFFYICFRIRPYCSFGKFPFKSVLDKI